MCRELSSLHTVWWTHSCAKNISSEQFGLYYVVKRAQMMLKQPHESTGTTHITSIANPLGAKPKKHPPTLIFFQKTDHFSIWQGCFLCCYSKKYIYNLLFQHKLSHKAERQKLHASWIRTRWRLERSYLSPSISLYVCLPSILHCLNLKNQSHWQNGK